jgi:hypothetical protein
MKTTIEIKGYQIVIDETEELLTVTAMKDDETVEEFSLELTEGGEDEKAQGEDGIKSFDDFGSEEEEDFDDEEDFADEEIQDETEDETQDETQDEIQDELEEEEEEEEESENKLESFQSFINKKN